MLRPLLLVVLLLAGAAAATAQTPSPEADSLEGWTEIGLVVDALSSDAVALGLSREEIRRQSLEGLRGAGIAVSDTALGRLYVHVGLVAGELGYSGAVQVGFVQRVTLRTGRSSWGSTWEQGRVMGGPRKNLRQHVAGLLDDLLRAFVEDWAAVNGPE